MSHLYTLLRPWFTGKETISLTEREQNRPKDPLRALGEFLLQRSKQYEGGGGANGTSTSA